MIRSRIVVLNDSFILGSRQRLHTFI